MFEIRYRNRFYSYADTLIAANAIVDASVAMGHARSDYAIGPPKPVVVRCNGHIANTFDTIPLAQAFVDMEVTVLLADTSLTHILMDGFTDQDSAIRAWFTIV